MASLKKNQVAVYLDIGGLVLVRFFEIGAIVYAAASFIAVLFQLCLAFGAPWGSYAMAGKFPGRFPPAMRIAALVQAALLILTAAIALSAAGISFPGFSAISGKLIWGVVAISMLSVIANSATPNAKERRIWLPVGLILLASSLMIAFGK